jgi:hypothetical protein
MWRWLAYTFSGVCLLLATAVAVLWVHSYWARDEILYSVEGPYAFVTVFTQPGEIIYLDQTALAVGVRAERAERGWLIQSRPHSALRVTSRPTKWPLFPTELRWHRSKTAFGGKRQVAAVAPFWLLTLAVLLGCVPGFWLWQRRRYLRRAGCCPVCGYDLRASPERCPECGTVRKQGT